MESNHCSPFFKGFLAFFVFILPFQWALTPAGGIDLALSRVLATLVVLFWLGESFRMRRAFLLSPLPLFCVSLFLSLSTLSFFWAENQGWAIRKALFLWNFFPLLLVFSDVLRDQATRRLIVRALIGGAALSALVGVLQFLTQFVVGVPRIFSWWTGNLLPFFLGHSFGEAVAQYPSLLVNISGITLLRASAFFPDPHMFAFYLGMTLPFALALAFQATGKTRTLYLLASALLLLADLLTFSRGGYIGLLAGGVAANLRLREKFESEIKSRGIKIDFFVPQPKLCTDNAAYIAAFAFFNSNPIGWEKIQSNPELTIDGQV